MQPETDTGPTRTLKPTKLQSVRYYRPPVRVTHMILLPAVGRQKVHTLVIESNRPAQ